MSTIKEYIYSYLKIGLPALLKSDNDNVELAVFENRNVFQDELMRFTKYLSEQKIIPEDKVWIVSAIIGEIGNNSFDHNLGNWPKERGIVFGYGEDSNCLNIVIADSGLGILKTLQRVKPELKNDKDALKIAFTKIVSGRAPEARGNGLKFVRENVIDNGMNLIFISGGSMVVLDGDLKIDNIENDYQGCLAILRIKK